MENDILIQIFKIENKYNLYLYLIITMIVKSTLIDKLPIEVVEIIYEYDGRYSKQYSVCVKDIDNAFKDLQINISMLRKEVRFREYVRSWLHHYSSFHSFILTRNKQRKKNTWKCNDD